MPPPGQTGSNRPDADPVAPWWLRHLRTLERVVLVIVALALAVQVALLIVDGGSWLAVLAVAVSAAGAGLVVRKPHVSLLLFAVAPLIATLAGWSPTGLWSIACFGGFLLALRGLPGLLAAVVVAVGNLLAAGAHAGTLTPSVDPEPSVAAFAGVALASAGSAIQGQSRYWEGLEQRTRDAIAAAQAAAARGIAEERLRIARDLHDSVGHNIAVLNMHLGAAEVHLPAEADATREDLHAARAAVNAVLQETQQILRVLRLNSGSNEAATQPVASYERIADLVDQARTAGMRVDAHIEQIDTPIPSAIGICAYRIVQESLTNAQRHGTGAVTLRIDHDKAEGVLVVEIINAIAQHPAPQPSGGHGIVGMRERAASVGGTVQVRTRGGVHQVSARLPLTETTS